MLHIKRSCGFIRENAIAGAQRLIFGDLHLEYIRAWREKELHLLTMKYNFNLHFPLWNLDYGLLLQELQSSGLQCRITAIANEECGQKISIGEVFDAGLIAKLPKGVDRFGENGEFHTYVVEIYLTRAGIRLHDE